MSEQSTKIPAGREPYQVLVFVCKNIKGKIEYLLLKRADLHVWQGVAGGGEDGESPLEAAIRETAEETGLDVSEIQQLPDIKMIPVLDVVDCYLWGKDVTEIPEYAFVAYIKGPVSIALSEEHEEKRWCDCKEAMKLLEWESSRRAIDYIEREVEIVETAEA